MAESDFNERFERKFFSQIPANVAASFTDAQVSAIKAAYGAERWDGHQVDVRGTIPLPGRRWYYVIVAGPDRRGRLRASPRGNPGAAARLFGAVVAIFMLFQLLLILAIGFAL